ncbi:MAG: NHL repeat-containing protein, partial [Planctomycetota bacterium]
TPVGVHLSVDGGLFVSNLADCAVLRFFDVPVAAPTAVDFVLAGFDEPPGRNNTGAAGPLGVGGDARGVLVADPGRNRILVHAEDDGAGGTLLPQTFQPAFAVIGQPDGASIGGNHIPLDGTVLGRPSGVAGDAARLFVCDPEHSRVLVFVPPPSVDGEGAAFALGQTSLTDSVKGGSDAARATLAAPKGVGFDGQNLAVSDAEAERLLIWTSVPTSNGAPADQALPNVVAEAVLIADDPLGGTLIAAVETSRHRVLVWRSLTLPFSNAAPPPPSFALGQPDLGPPLPNNPALLTADRQLAEPRGVWLDAAGRLYVSDAGNARVLIWTTLPTGFGEAADQVLGQADLLTQGAVAPDATRLGGSPAGGAADASRIVVLDSLAHRALLFEGAPTTDAAARSLFGQPVFEAALPQRGGAASSPRSLSIRGVTPLGPRRIDEPTPGAVIIGSDLYLADPGNRRVLRIPLP